MATLRIGGDRFRRRFETFNEIGATEAMGVSRPALSEANKTTRDTLVDWFESVGLTVEINEIKNIFRRRHDAVPDAEPLMSGSHIDSQHGGGRFDGVIGTLGALEIVKTLDDARVGAERPLEIVAWTNEKGARFQPDMLSSGVYTGQFDVEYAHDRTDKAGHHLGDELERIGYKDDRRDRAADPHCYFELHVKQG